MSNEVIGSEQLWGAPSIARALGTSTSFVYSIANDPNSPVYKPPGTNRLFALRSELRAWQRTKPTKK